MTQLLFIFVPAGIAGTVMLVVGLRGRRVDDHPICKRCGFDLFGRPDAQQCPECGRKLTGPRRVVKGNRVRRKTFAWLGILMLLASVGTSGWLIWNEVSGDWQRYKPVWWLCRDLRQAGARRAALTELGRRQLDSTLSRGQYESVAAEVLALQGDPQIKWFPGLGDFFELAWDEGRVSDAQARRYVEQAVSLHLTVRPKVRLGDTLPFVITESARVGTGRASVPGVEFTYSGRIVIDGHEHDIGAVKPDKGREYRSWIDGKEYRGRHPGIATWNVAAVDAISDRLVTPGTHVVEMIVKAKAELTSSPDWHEWEFGISNALQIAPADQDSLLLVDSADLEPLVRQCISVRRVGRDFLQLSLYPSIKDAPVGICHDVYLRDGERTVFIGQVIAASGKSEWTRLASTIREASIPSQVDLILEPNPEVARQTLNVIDLWNRPIVIRNVPVEDVRMWK